MSKRKSSRDLERMPVGLALPAVALTPVVTPGFAAHGPIPTNWPPCGSAAFGTEQAKSLGDMFRPFLPAT